MEPGSEDADATGESLNDIQSYLATFNKEIQETGHEGAAAKVDAQVGVQYVQQGNVQVVSNQATGEMQEEEGPPTLEPEVPQSEGQMCEVIHEDQPLLTPAPPPSGDDEVGGQIVEIGELAPTVTTVVSSGDSQQLQTITLGNNTEGEIVELADSSEAAVQVLASVAATSIPQAPVPPEVHGGTQLVAVQNAQDSSQPEIVAVSSGDTGNMVTVSGGETMMADGGELQVLANVSDQVQTVNAVGSDESSVILNTGSSYQTVTIVPSEVNQGGEVSYVLIVSQPEGDQVKDVDGRNISLDMSVYDFKEEKGVGGGDGQQKKKNSSPRKLPHGIAAQLMCNYCNYTSPKRYLLTRHMKTHSEERPHKCNICDRGFKTIASLQNHINTHTGTRPHKCKECESAFTTSGELVRHTRYRHTFEKPHKCTECDYASVELSKLKRHMRSHTGERPYQCPHCSYASPDTYKLKRHLRIHTGEKPYECDVCHARFTQSNSLKAHRLIHTGNKPVFQCELCPTTCGRKTDLKIHVQKLHTSDKPLQCKKCGKSFPDRYTFKLHLKTHDGEKCFKCDMCPYAALSQRHLESHLLTHTGEKPFTCDECEMTFRQKQLLKRHKNLYHTPDYVPPEPKDKTHECSDCNRVFAHRGNLLRHMAVHDPDHPNHYQMKMEDEEGEEEEYEEEDEEGIMQGENGVDVIEAATNEVIVRIEEVAGEGLQVMEDEADGETSSPEKKKRGRGRPKKVVVLQHSGAEITGKNAQEILMAMEEHEEEEEEEEEEEDAEEPPVVEAATPVKRGRGRPAARAPEPVQEEETDDVQIESVISPRGRGRPPKVQQQVITQETVGTPRRGRGRPSTTAIVAKEEEVEQEDESPRTRGRRKRGSSPEAEATPTKRKKPETPKRGRKKEDPEDEEAEQKKKDIETCFGFDDDEGEEAGEGDRQQQMVVLTVEGVGDQVQTVDIGSILQVQQT